MNTWITGDSFATDLSSYNFDMAIADPIYGDIKHINDTINLCLKVCSGTVCVFMSPGDVQFVRRPIDQLCHWLKPESTKNTQKRYSSFIEAIAFFHMHMKPQFHWSNRTGIFTDRLFSNEIHPWKKPDSLIERLILNHSRGGAILDPCAGSGTVHYVCKKLGVPSVSIEIDIDLVPNDC